MKKSLSILWILAIITGCSMPSGRSWIIPLKVDPSDLSFTPSQLESFAERREKVLDSIGDGVVILRSQNEHSQNRHQFRPENYFFYLTGIESPGVHMMMGRNLSHPYNLCIEPQSVRSLIYEGERPDSEEIAGEYQPDTVVGMEKFLEMARLALNSGSPVYADPPDLEFLEMLMQDSQDDPGSSVNPPAEIRPISMIVDKLRVIKEPWEVERLQKACNITSMALTLVMEDCSPGQFEFEMESIIEGTFLRYGSAMPGFPSIVGSGPKSTILHYESNDRQMGDGELLLMDIGAEYGRYTADITRTIPVNGRFSEEQRTIYQLVLDAQKRAIDSLIPGNRISDGHMAAREVILEGLHRLGLITDSTSAWQAKFYVIYPSSHYLGLEVHDVGDYGGFFADFANDGPDYDLPGRILEPGMVLTIEPGLYFREGGLDQLHRIFGHRVDSLEMEEFIGEVRPVYEEFENIGVRIEDDILITRNGNINLSRYAPKEIDDIEQLMK